MNQVTMIGTMIEPVLDGMGYDLVRVQLGGGQDPCLQIMVERTDRAEMTVDDCATISRQISKLLDEEDPISDAYTLEVSSPGIDRPLVGLGDYDRFAGFDARVESREAVLGRKRFKGVLGGTDGNEILIEVDGETYAVPFHKIHRAKLLLTDELIAASQKAHT
jgi:ribosome maturation factor RimP